MSFVLPGFSGFFSGFSGCFSGFSAFPSGFSGCSPSLSFFLFDFSEHFVVLLLKFGQNLLNFPLGLFHRLPDFHDLLNDL